ncbi:hypothetical protein C8R42DRAFT_457443 [Lentinula raphanica]|nr:hypothetical protein C8R42DRAFT_457443 [Lentinula raphanica]
MVLMSRSSHGIQQHLNTFSQYCHTSNLSVSAGKSWVMLFGKLVGPRPALSLAGTDLVYLDISRYVGIHFQSSGRHLFAPHYLKKHTAALTASRGIVACDLIVGFRRLDPSISKQLYSSLVDCHLTHGCEVIIDTNKSSLSLLEDAQHLILRRMLGLSHNSVLAPLFTETGIMPIRYRRIILALRYLIYVLALPPDHYAHLSLRESSRLREAGERSWLSDLDWAIQHLPGSSLSLPSLQTLSTTPESITDLTKNIVSCSMTSLQHFIDNSSRLAFLQGRREPHKDGTKSHSVSTLRHYLTQVRNPAHRVTLTRLLCGDLTPVTFHASPASTRPLSQRDQASKSCRACRDVLQPETPQHVFLQCHSIPELIHRREAFLVEMSQYFPLPHLNTFNDASALHYIKTFIFDWTAVIKTAHFIHDGLSYWKTFINEGTDMSSDEEEDEISNTS